MTFPWHTNSFLRGGEVAVTANWYLDGVDPDGNWEPGNTEIEETEITVYADEHCVSFNLTTDPNRTFSIRTHDLLHAIGKTWAEDPRR